MNSTFCLPYFPSIEDIKAAYGGRVTRLGRHKVLWSPNERNTFTVVPTTMGFTLRPYWSHPHDREMWQPSAPERPSWTETVDWAWRNSAIAEAAGVHVQTVVNWRRKLAIPIL
jgi:hypothetical protein